ncbi:ROK family protein [Bifidobacterium sp. SMB2]|uniref:ROK family protein n=1 Tax=Bifidobacterium saimiriisciurei TaxID=2661627 RepID=A0ABX0C7P5_9BIFI|nr:MULTISPECIES: ROK family protein [Bifidobacterium]NEG95746.1 ROK family protein [Bifidobacterium sp. SMB2]NEH11173.1 ROK family protein [Bifidobacterium saimiriisciurei]
MPRARSINQDDLRNHNLSVVLTALLQSTSPLSRAQLAKETGLTKATMSLLSEILLGNGVVEQLAPQQESSNGRPSTPLGFRSGKWAGIGMQINTDGYGYMVLDIAGKTVAHEWVGCDLTNVDPNDAFSRLDALVAPVEARLKRRRFRVVGTGLALPGLVTADRSLIMAPNLGWSNLELDRFDVVRRLGAVGENEANLAAIAQVPGYAVRRNRAETPLDPNDSFLYISTDVGVGGAIVRSGSVVRGDHGFGGELGHVSVDMNGPQCRCGRRGCLEMYAGRRELVRAAGIAEGDEAARPEYADELYRRWREGDGKAVRAIEQALDAMSSVAVSVINMVDVSTIVLGGFWSTFEEDLTARLRMRIVPQILARYALNIRVIGCRTVSRPALYGAACHGLRQFVEHPVRYLDV